MLGPTLVVGLVISLFRCFVALCSRVVLLQLLLEFLLLWVVRNWLSLLSLVREAHPPYSLQVASFSAGSGCELQESVAAVAGCACCKRGIVLVGVFACTSAVLGGTSRYLGRGSDHREVAVQLSGPFAPVVFSDQHLGLSSFPVRVLDDWTLMRPGWVTH
ncbi:hypothetical protein Taro_008832 [Colocasia esculenta]|uniref:Uncharacterized protein n=1 Tax=Colocasia esculenta TaxID=4460 RepID=A0A843TUR8_COLES|nr:hypothetical protein [Colocasia esculenta]